MCSEKRIVHLAKQMFKCDTARISSPSKRHFLIIGIRRHTREDRRKDPKAGQWFRNGEPHDFPYVAETCIASGDTYEQLFESMKTYKKLLGMQKGWPRNVLEVAKLLKRPAQAGGGGR